MTFERLREEYRTAGIGTEIVDEVKSIATRMVRKYPPEVYGQVADWRDGIDDLVQDVVTEALIGESQLDYLFLVSIDLDEFRRLLTRQVRRVLTRRRTRTVLDNLLARAKEAASKPPFTRQDENGRWAYSRTGFLPRPDPSDAELHDAARLVAAVPTVRPGGGLERAPMVFTAAALVKVLEIVSAVLGDPVHVSELDRVLRLVLTSWVPSFLNEDEEVKAVEGATSAPDDLAVVDEVTDLILATMTPPQERVLALKLAGVSDSEVARLLSVSRPTVIKYRKEVLNVLEQSLSGLDAASQQAVIDEVSSRILVRGFDDV